MNWDEMALDSLAFGMVISILGYQLGLFLKKKFCWAILNPLLISIVAVIVFLLAFQIDYDTYNASAQYLSYLLTPATVCLAIPLYQQIRANSYSIPRLSWAFDTMQCIRIRIRTFFKLVWINITCTD